MGDLMSFRTILVYCRYVLMQSNSGVTNEVASTGKATQACITEVSKSEFLINQDTASLFLGESMPLVDTLLSLSHDLFVITACNLELWAMINSCHFQAFTARTSPDMLACTLVHVPFRPRMLFWKHNFQLFCFCYEILLSDVRFGHCHISVPVHSHTAVCRCQWQAIQKVWNHME